MIISVVAAKMWYLKKMYGFYWATLYSVTSVRPMVYSVKDETYSVVV